MIHTFYGVIRDSKQNIKVDKDGICEGFTIKPTLEEALNIINKSYKIARSRYGFQIYIREDGLNKSIFFRFGNATTKKRDSAATFVRKNYKGEDLVTQIRMF